MEEGQKAQMETTASEPGFAEGFCKNAAKVGDVVMLHHKELGGPRPAVVMKRTEAQRTAPGNYVDVNVMVHGGEDTAFLKMLRERPEGNTFVSIPLFGSTTPEATEGRFASGSVFCTWRD